MENLNKYLEDKRFIAWVFNPTRELEEWWTSYRLKNEEEAENIVLAQKVLNKFKTTDKNLPVEDKILLFSNILKNIEHKKERQKKLLKK